MCTETRIAVVMEGGGGGEQPKQIACKKPNRMGGFRDPAPPHLQG